MVNTGLIGMIDSNRVLKWSKEIPRPSGYESLGLKYITAEEDRIFIGGRSGPTLERIEGLVGEIDTQGNILWEKTIDVSNNNEEVISLEYVAGTNAAELIALGTGGLVDFGGPQRTFLTSINVGRSYTTKNHMAESLTYYPNPVEGILHLVSAHEFNTIEIINMKGEVLSTLPTGSKTVDFSLYPSGTYFLNCKINNSPNLLKVIKN